MRIPKEDFIDKLLRGHVSSSLPWAQFLENNILRSCPWGLCWRSCLQHFSQRPEITFSVGDIEANTGASNCQWGGLTDQNICNIHGDAFQKSCPLVSAGKVMKYGRKES